MQQGVRRFYEDTYPVDPTDAPGGFHHGRQQIYRQTLSMFESTTEGRLLDVGCYDGYLTRMVGQKVRAHQLYGVDFNQNVLPLAAEKGIITSHVDLNNESLPYDDAFFDCVCCSEVIEHVLSPDHLLRELHRVLKPSGYAVITTPNLASWRNRMVLLLGWQPYYTEVSTELAVGNPHFRGKPSGHIRVFTPLALQELISAAGLQIEQFSGMVYGFPTDGSLFTRLAALIDRLVGKRVPALSDDLMVRVKRA